MIKITLKNKYSKLKPNSTILVVMCNQWSFLSMFIWEKMITHKIWDV
jgi:hypothetical protein